jgi:hypothetical protein
MTSRPCGESHDWVRHTPELQDHYIGILIKHMIQTEFKASLKHKTNECAFAAQEAHTYPKSHHELNI